MSSGLAAVLPWLFGIGVAAVLVAGYVYDRKRRERIRTYCLARGWEYRDEDPSLAGRFTGDPFGRGERPRATNVVSGMTAGRPFTAFDYSYETSSTDGQGRRRTTTHRYTVCAVPLPAYLPRLEVVPEHALSRIAQAVGLGRDVDLESEDFNRRFTVRTAEPKFASDVLTPRTMQYLLSVPVESWRIEGTTIIWWAEGRLDPAEVLVAAAVLDRVADGIPAFVWKDHGYDPHS